MSDSAPRPFSSRAADLLGAALDQLSAALAAGHSTALVTVLRTMARFHRYSWSNQLLISLQRPEATRVAGFRTWLAMGRVVRRGERGIAILAPLVRRHAPDPDADHEGEGVAPARLVGFRTVFVFDLAQTDGAPLPTLAHPVGDPGPSIVRLTAHLESRGISCDLVPRVAASPGALGASYGGRIEVRGDLTPAETLTTFLHEAAHELLHRDVAVGRLTHTVRELEADAVACVVAEALGVQAVQASADYIHLHQGSAQLLAASLVRIRRVAGELLEVTQAEVPEAPGANALAS